VFESKGMILNKTAHQQQYLLCTNCLEVDILTWYHLAIEELDRVTEHAQWQRTENYVS